MATLNYTGKTSTSISVSISGLSYPSTSYDSFLMTHNGQEWQSIPKNGSSTTVYGTYSGLTPNTTYSIDVYATYLGTSYYQGTITQTTDSPPLPTLPTPTLNTALTEKTATTIQVTLNAVSGATGYGFDLSNGAYGSGPSLTALFTGLTPSTQYTVYFYAYGTGYNNSPTGSAIATTLANVRPSNWAWSTTVATDAEVNMSANDWNNFCIRINAFRTYKNLSYFVFQTAISGWDIPSSHVREALSAINQMSPPTSIPGYVYTDDYIQAYTYNRLKDSLNSIV